MNGTALQLLTLMFDRALGHSWLCLDKMQSLKSGKSMSSFVHHRSHHLAQNRLIVRKFAEHSHENNRVNNVAIIGGGLAGLSTAWHLLEAASNPLHITIYDKCKVGTGGASAVAGGLMHPFSPKGKLIHFGLEALEQSKHLVQIATMYQPSCLIQPHLYRIALNEGNVQQLQETATKYPDLATWLSSDDINSRLGADSMGGLKLSNGCQVVHVPQYLQALWKACEDKASKSDGSIRWEISKMNCDASNQLKMNYDAVVHAAGAGILQDKMLDKVELPVQLIRGQSILMSLPDNEAFSLDNEALLCGKYISPVPCIDSESNYRQFIIGATHEYKSTKLNQNEVLEELKQRSYQLSPRLWEHGTVEQLTSGVRMQSNRGKYGRMPIIGRLQSKEWIFTGLSSRGLIYHGLFGSWIANAILHDNEQLLLRNFQEFDWWKQKK